MCYQLYVPFLMSWFLDGTSSDLMDWRDFYIMVVLMQRNYRYQNCFFIWDELLKIIYNGRRVLSFISTLIEACRWQTICDQKIFSSIGYLLSFDQMFDVFNNRVTILWQLKHKSILEDFLQKISQIRIVEHSFNCLHYYDKSIGYINWSYLVLM